MSFGTAVKYDKVKVASSLSREYLYRIAGLLYENSIIKLYNRAKQDQSESYM